MVPSTTVVARRRVSLVAAAPLLIGLSAIAAGCDDGGKQALLPAPPSTMAEFTVVTSDTAGQLEVPDTLVDETGDPQLEGADGPAAEDPSGDAAQDPAAQDPAAQEGGPGAAAKPTRKPAVKPAGAATTVAPSLRVGSTGAAVQALQTNLNKLGYLPGRSDGRYDRPTQAAVDEFVGDYALTPSKPGADATVQQALAAAVAKAPRCNRGAIVRRTQPQAGYAWDARPVCTFGWAVMMQHPTAGSGPGIGVLYRIRREGWVASAPLPAYRVNLGLAEGSAMPPRRFAQVFGAAGWPFRVRRADDAVAFLVAAAKLSPIELAQEQARMWLDEPGLQTWTEWVVNFKAAGTPAPCTKGGALRGWTCSWQADNLTFTLSFDARLTKATMTSK